MKERLHFESPAKVNLRLEILKKRKDGYHELITILQKIDLHDIIHLSLKKEKEITVATDHPDLPVRKSNLVFQAAQSILERSDYRGGLHIEIEKRIPIGAGLGGGSSNAAATLKALNQLLRMDLPEKELMGMGLRIGADVPFFFMKGSAIGSGIGERLKEIELPGLWYVLIYPNFEVSTRWAYQNFTLPCSTAQGYSRLKGGSKKSRSGSTLSLRPETSESSVELLGPNGKPCTVLVQGKPGPSSRAAEGLTKVRFRLNFYKLLRTPRGISRILRNDLEEVVSRQYPQIDIMKRLLLDAGALGALMTGSGPTVFGIFSEEEDALEAYQKVKKTVKGKGWIVLKAHSIPV